MVIEVERDGDTWLGRYATEEEALVVARRFNPNVEIAHVVEIKATLKPRMVLSEGIDK